MNPQGREASGEGQGNAPPSDLDEDREHPIGGPPEADGPDGGSTRIPVTDSGKSSYPDSMDEEQKKAYEMAHAGKEHRDMAAARRGAVRAVEEMVENPDDKSLAHRVELHEGTRSKSGHGHKFATERYGLNSESKKTLESYHEESETLDKEAGAIEEWHGVLYDHAPSQAFKDRYPDVVFVTTRLAAIEDLYKTEMESIEQTEERLEGVTGFKVLSDSRFQAEVGSISKLLAFADEDEREAKTEEWEGLKSNPDTTMREVAAFYKEIATKYGLARRREKASITAVMLEDVRSGRAAMEEVSKHKE